MMKLAVGSTLAAVRAPVGTSVDEMFIYLKNQMTDPIVFNPIRDNESHQVEDDAHIVIWNYQYV